MHVQPGLVQIAIQYRDSCGMTNSSATSNRHFRDDVGSRGSRFGKVSWACTYIHLTLVAVCIARPTNLVLLTAIGQSNNAKVCRFLKK